MLEEGITYEEEVLILSWKSAFMDNEIALFVGGFIQVLFWVNFKNIVTHLEADWLEFWGDIFTAVFNVAESFV